MGDFMRTILSTELGFSVAFLTERIYYTIKAVEE